jgi:hypothetical protein
VVYLQPCASTGRRAYCVLVVGPALDVLDLHSHESVDEASHVS